jgi:hypothetical protein
MKQPYFKIILGVMVCVLIIFTVRIILTNAPQDITPSDTNTIVNDVQQNPLGIEGVKVPEGWYSHQTYGVDHESTLLSRTKEFPNNLAVEQIGISELTTSLSPENYITSQGGSLDGSNVDWIWGIYKGHKTLSVVGVGEVAQWFVYVFGDETIYVLSLSPNDNTNPNLEKDRDDFWKVITYYAQQPSFEKLSRAETQQNCKTVDLPEDERDMQVESETGYVVFNLMQDNKRKYVFFNYNDDLSQCTSSVKTFLENVKISALKLAQ